MSEILDKTIVVRIDAALLKKGKAAAAKRRLSLGGLLRQLLIDYLEGEKK